MRAADGPRTGKMDGSREVCSSSRLGHDSGGFIGHIRITQHPLDVVFFFCAVVCRRCRLAATCPDIRCLRWIRWIRWTVGPSDRCSRSGDGTDGLVMRCCDVSFGPAETGRVSILSLRPPAAHLVSSPFFRCRIDPQQPRDVNQTGTSRWIGVVRASDAPDAAIVPSSQLKRERVATCWQGVRHGLH